MGICWPRPKKMQVVGGCMAVRLMRVQVGRMASSSPVSGSKGEDRTVDVDYGIAKICP